MALFNITKTERELKYGQLAYTKVPEIMNKYNLLIEEMSSKNDQKHLKITNDKLELLYDPDNVTDERLKFELDILKNLPEEFSQLNYDMFCYSYDYKHQIDKNIIKNLQSIAEVIHQKFYGILNKKIYNSNGVYFSTIEQITISEILEIIDEYHMECEKVVKVAEEFCNNYDIEIDDFWDQFGCSYYYSFCSWYDVRYDLKWIFNKNINKL